MFRSPSRSCGSSTKTLRAPITTLLAIALLGGTAHAEDGGASSWVISPGVNVGYGLGDGQGFILGLETSFFFFVDGNDIELFSLGDDKSPKRNPVTTKWLGVYADAVRDFGNDTFRTTIGPELGYKTIGIDGGYVREFGNDDRMGVTVRGCLTAAVVGLCARYTRMYDPGQNLVDLGLLLKIPYPF